MARPKKQSNIQLNFDEKTEVCMTSVNADDLEQIQKELDLARLELEKTKLDIETNKQLLKNSPVAEVKTINDPNVSVKGVALSEKIAAQKIIDSEMITGKFVNVRVKGKSEKLPYHKYADDPVKWYNFDCGKTYTIPRGFADQINGGDETNPCYYTPTFIKNEGAIINPDEPGSGLHAVDTTNKKFMFVREW